MLSRVQCLCSVFSNSGFYCFDIRPSCLMSFCMLWCVFSFIVEYENLESFSINWSALCLFVHWHLYKFNVDQPFVISFFIHYFQYQFSQCEIWEMHISHSQCSSAIYAVRYRNLLPQPTLECKTTATFCKKITLQSLKATQNSAR